MIFAPSPIKLLVVQSFCWLCIIPFYAMADTRHVLLSLFFYTLYAGFGVAMTFHRVLSHRAYRFHPWVNRTLQVLACLANVGSPLGWVAVHRAHHRYNDTELDPHSPNVKSSAFVLLWSMYAKPRLRFVPDLLRDPFMLVLHRYYFLLQVPWILLLYLLGGWWAVLACHVIPGGLTWLAGSFLNWYNHVGGQVSNRFLTGYLVFGEGWHRNHHERSTDVTTTKEWWQFDAIYWFSRLLRDRKTHGYTP